MKNVLLFLLLPLASLQGFCQVSAAASVTSRATIIDPIKIDKTVDLDFGNIIGSYNPGMVILSPDGSRVAYGVQISTSMPGDVSPAEAVVTHGNNSYSITLPNNFTLFNDNNPGQVLIINEFTVEPLSNDAIQGTDIVKIGATLHLEANQVAGYYSNSGGFHVTVTYN